jgi:hypothetical protein
MTTLMAILTTLCRRTALADKKPLEVYPGQTGGLAEGHEYDMR